MDNVFFQLSKVVWGMIAPDSSIIIILLFTCFLLWRGSYARARILLSALTAALIFLAVFPVGEWLAYPLETRFQTNPALPENVNGIIVLAGPENAALSSAWRQMQFKEGAERYTAFMVLARRYPDATLVFTGGSGSLTKQEYKAADYAAVFFAEQGMDVNRITFESESRNTYENALYSKSIVAPLAGEKWLLVTSAMHMPRSVGIFCKLEWPVIPYPVDHTVPPEWELSIAWRLSAHLNDLMWALREWSGLLAYTISDKTGALLPDQC
jgi:uncharacterized SAM-binding protein YcdF (DUF218 family)